MREMKLYTYVEVEANPNCPLSANQVYRNLTDPVAVKAVRIWDGAPEATLCDVTGWDADGPVPAYAVRVEDSSEGAAYLVYGGAWGLRLRPAGAARAWSLDDPEQWGETHLVLADASDMLTEEAAGA